MIYHIFSNRVFYKIFANIRSTKGCIIIGNAVCEYTCVRITLTIMHNAYQIRVMLFKVEFSNLASRNLSRNKRLKKFTNINLQFVLLWV